MALRHYVVRPGGEIVPEPDLMTWAEWYEGSVGRTLNDGGRVVDDTFLPDGTRVSTVFLGLDHSHHKDGPSVLFETMIFATPEIRSDWVDYCRRYSTADDARRGHDETCERLRRGLRPDDELPEGWSPAVYT